MQISTTAELGKLIRDERKRQGLTQQDVALACGVGLRYIVDLERGKETAQIGKALHLVKMLGLRINITPNSQHG